MAHESEPNPTPDLPDAEQQVEYAGSKPPGCGKIILWLVIGGIVMFLAAVAFVFGACLLA